MKLDQVNSSVLQAMLKNSQRSTNKTAQSATQASDEVSLSNTAKRSDRVIQFSLSQSLTINGKNYNVATQDDTDDENAESLFDFQKVADNVLSFVTNTINARKQAGDDNEALEKMLGQARTGIDKGFGDARKELGDSGTLTDSLSKGIDKSYDLIQKGLSDYEKDLFGDTTDATTTDSAADPTSVANTASSDATNQTKTPKEIGNSILTALSGQKSASLELVTKEGDKVTIQFDDQQQWRQQQNSSLAKKALQTYGELGGTAKKNDTANTSSNSAAVYSRTTQFSFKVEGDLSSSELTSISDMVNKVGNLSDSFFGGNVGDALQQAQKLDLSDSELASLSLDLYQKQAVGWQSNSGADALANAVNEANTATNATTNTDTTNTSGLTDNQQAAAALPDAFNQLGDYLTQLQSMFNQMIAAFNPNMQTDVQRWVATQQHPEQSADQINQFVSFNQQMQQAMATLSSNQSGSTDTTTA
jgi:hypothetical protein